MILVSNSQDQIHELRKRISAIEWDLPNIKNKDLQTIRQKELTIAKNSLQEMLLNSNNN